MISKQHIKRAENEVKRDADLFLLTVFASIVASIGIIFNNIYLIIGGMLISPLFDPIISIMVFLVENNWKKALSSLGTLVILIFISIALSQTIALSKLMYTQFPGHMLEFYPHIITFFIAVVLGIIGAFMWIWPKTSNTIAGISVAISLVPPLSNIGIAFVNGQSHQMMMSMVTFCLNFFGILFGSFLVFYFVAEYYSKKKSK
jgi:uncharacterized hydrophobic protein (TIGR00271 family)